MTYQIPVAGLVYLVMNNTNKNNRYNHPAERVHDRTRRQIAKATVEADKARAVKNNWAPEAK